MCEEHLGVHESHLVPETRVVNGITEKKPTHVALRQGRSPATLLRLGFVPFSTLQGHMAYEATNRLKVIHLAAYTGFKKKALADRALTKRTITSVSRDLLRLRALYAKFMATRISKAERKLVGGPGGLKTNGRMVPSRLEMKNLASLELTHTRVIYARAYVGPSTKLCGNTSTMVGSVNAN